MILCLLVCACVAYVSVCLYANQATIKAMTFQTTEESHNLSALACVRVCVLTCVYLNLELYLYTLLKMCPSVAVPTYLCMCVSLLSVC